MGEGVTTPQPPPRPLPPYPLSPPVLPTYHPPNAAPEKQKQSNNCPLWNEGNCISQTYLGDNQSYLVVHVSSSYPHVGPEVARRTGKDGGGTKGTRQGAFSPQSHEFLRTGQMLPHIFYAALTSGLLFPLIRVQCSQ